MLKVDGLCAGYGAADVVIDVSLELPRGACHAIIGANGAGKTTLLSALSGLVPMRRGQAFVSRQPLGSASIDQRLRLGLVHCPEGRRVFAHMSVADNLALGAHIEHDANKVAARLAEVYGRFPKLGERRTQLAGTMSGGEQQMLAIGRALMAAPKVLLLDEPSLGLAPKMAELVFATIRELTESGITTLLVEQNAAMALRLAEHAYVLEHGRMVLNGPAAELRHDARVQRAYLGG